MEAAASKKKIEGKRLAVNFTIIFSVCLFISYLIIWATMSKETIGRSDFVSYFVAGQMVLSGKISMLYSVSAQKNFFTSDIYPANRGVLPFIEGPITAFIMVPFAKLGLVAGFRVFSFLQFIFEGIGIFLTAKVAPWPKKISIREKLAICLLGFVGVGSFITLIQGQGDGLFVLGAGLGYYLYKKRALKSAGAVFLISIFAIKPNFAVGVFAFFVFSFSWELVCGALIAGATVLFLDFISVGSSGIASFITQVIGEAKLWPLPSMEGFSGLATSIFGTGVLGWTVIAILTILGFGELIYLGYLARLERISFELALGCTLFLTVLISPHVNLHDLILFNLAFILSIVGVIQEQFSIKGRKWVSILIGLWFVFILTGFEQVGKTTRGFPGRLLPLLGLVFCGVLYLIARSAKPRQEKL